MTVLIPLVIAVPLGMAAGIAAVGKHIRPVIPDLLGALTAAAVTVMCVLLAVRSRDRTLVYWFGDWRPGHGFAPGIAFVVDYSAAAEAALAGIVVLAALLFSWRYFEGVRYLFHTLALVFLAGMVGFALSGDLFNIFVFFELMSVAGYALCAYRVEQPSVEQGALNFAVLNGMGAFSLLMGIGVLYGATGALNLADIGTRLGGHGALAAVALALVTVGFAVKAGAAPFHFWLSDAYAIAATPVAAMFTAVMGELAFHVYARVRTTAFAAAIGQHGPSVALIVLGLLSAIVGGLMCALQADAKRQVAFLTISAAGVVLTGIGLSSAAGLAGSIRYMLAGGLLRGGFMLGLGVAITRLGGCDELRLHGAGRRQPLLGVVLALCALGLAAPPGTATFTALATVYAAASAVGWGWLCPFLVAGTALSSATLLRGLARVFLGWGATRDPALTSQPDDTAEEEPEPQDQGSPRGAWTMIPGFALFCVAMALAAVPDGWVQAAARGVYEPAMHTAIVLHGADSRTSTASGPRTGAGAYAWATVGFAASVLLAAAGLWWQRIRSLLPTRALRAPVGVLKAVHSGGVGDYATWFAVGLAGLGLGWVLTLH